MFHFSGGKPGSLVLFLCMALSPDAHKPSLFTHALPTTWHITREAAPSRSSCVIHHRKAAMLCDNLQKAVVCVLNAICGLGADKNPKVSVPRAGGTLQPGKIAPYLFFWSSVWVWKSSTLLLILKCLSLIISPMRRDSQELSDDDFGRGCLSLAFTDGRMVVFHVSDNLSNIPVLSVENCRGLLLWSAWSWLFFFF